MAGNLLARAFSRASFSEALSEEAYVRAMLAFESALACSEAEAGVVPAAAADVIAAVCERVQLSAQSLVADGRLAGALAIPLVKALTGEVRAVDAKAASFVRYGSTRQDVLDTALLVCMRPCVAEADRVLRTSIARLAEHARRHASVVMLGRTMMQPARRD